jgi:chemotaxis protein methyltransferase CheR
MLNSVSFGAELKESFHHLVAKHTGLVIRELDKNSFYEKICSRINTLKISSALDYYKILDSNTIKSHQEWENLVFLLTNNESYFFRDKEQLNILKNRIFPELIKRQQHQKTIRICSAGCSTGQEPYTLAIILKELLPDFETWDLKILGIDIDRKALEAAQIGIYDPWSFRGVSENIKQKYFRQIGNRYQLIPQIKEFVKFQTVNLVKDSFPHPHSQLREMDLIICRNVFIYFQNAAIAQVTNKIYHSLKPLGYFLAGHTELSRVDLTQFNKLIFPESIVYQHPISQDHKPENKIEFFEQKAIKISSNSANISHKKTSRVKQPYSINHFDAANIIQSFQNAGLSSTLQEKITQAEHFFSQENYESAIEKVQNVLEQDSEHFQAHYLLAKIYGNLGQYELAIQSCQKAIKVNFLAIEPHSLLAKIAEEREDYLEAKRILKQVIYLNPSSARAYLDLSHIYQKEGDLKRAEKMKESALSLAR